MLVVDMPDTSYVGAGATFLIPRVDWRPVSSVHCPYQDCLRLPRVIRARSRVVISDEAAASLPTMQAEAGALVPADVSYAPRLRVVRDGKASIYDASSLGIAVAAIHSEPIVPVARRLRGVLGTRPLDALAYLPVNASYARRIQPADWLGVTLPPLQATLDDVASLEDEGVVKLAVGTKELPLDTPTDIDMHLDASWTSGARVRINDVASGAPLSTETVVQPCVGTCDQKLRFRSVGGALASSLLSELVVRPARPDPNVALSWRVYATLGSFASLHVPTLPQSVEFRVRALSAEGTEIPARVMLRSKAANVPGQSAFDIRADFNNLSAPVQIFAGSYRWTLIPQDARYAISSGEVTLTPGMTELPLPVAPKRLLQGRIVGPLGQPVAGAMIDLIPEFVVGAGSALSGDVDVQRPAQTMTDANGAFSLWADDGRYDLRVMTPAWSGLGDALRAGVVVPALAGEIDIGAVRLRAPTLLQFHLRDPEDLGTISLEGMTVRLYRRVTSELAFKRVATARSDKSGAVILRWSDAL